jgi:glycosyltransferase involved in cell wall biosynthesis
VHQMDAESKIQNMVNKKVLIVGGFEGNGRDDGGVTSILRGLKNLQGDFASIGFSFSYLNTCLVQRTSASNGKLRLANIKNYFLVKKRLRQSLRKDKPDIVFVHSATGLALLKDCFLAKAAKRWSRKQIKTIVQIHSADSASIFSKNHGIKRVLISIINKYVDSLILLSEKLKSFMTQAGCRSLSFVVPNFTNCHFSQESFTQKIGIETSENMTLNCLFIGSIQKQKGVFELLEAFQKANLPNANLVFAGGYVNETERHQFEKLLKTAKNVSYVGYVQGEQKINLLKWSEVMLLPSYTEGFPVSLIEGITFGDCIIATNVGAIPEFFKSCGDIIEPNNVSQLESSLKNLYYNKEKMIQKQKDNFIYAQHFNQQSYVTALSLIFCALTK